MKKGNDIGAAELIMFGLVLFSMLGMFAADGHLQRVQNIRPYKLTLTEQGCRFAGERLGMPTNVQDGNCVVEVLFYPNEADSGGAIFADPEDFEPRFVIGGAQVIAIERAGERPPSEQEDKARIWMGVSIALVMAVLLTLTVLIWRKR